MQSDFDRLIRLAETEAITGLRRSCIYALIKAGDFPAPAKIGGASRWSLFEVRAWMRERLNARAA
jgi:prophage regulatory protein